MSDPEMDEGSSDMSADASNDQGSDPASVPWLPGVSPENQALLQAKGWANGDDMLQSYRHLESMLGRERVAVPDEQAEDAEWDQFYDALGCPADPAEYGFARPDDYPEELYDPGRAEQFATLAYELGLTPAQASALHDAEVEVSRELASGLSQTAQVEARSFDADLRQEWGSDYDTNIERARHATRALATDQEVTLLEHAIGSGPMLKLFARLGSALSEDVMAGTGGNGAAALDAKSEIDSLTLDGTFTSALQDRRHPGHRQAVARWRSLHERAYPGTWSSQN